MFYGESIKVPKVIHYMKEFIKFIITRVYCEYSIQFSVVNCTKGNGVMEWKCLSDGKFDGVLPHVSECWINDILDKIDNIIQIEEVREV